LRNVCLRLSGSPDQVASIFRLDTNYGGGKTHGLIALTHATRGMTGVPNIAEFVDPALLPVGEVRIAAFDGENADPLNGRPLEPGLRAYTPWGEIAYQLAGRAGYEKVRGSDEQSGAPGAETIKELFGGKPTLILMDELSVYLRKLKVRDRDAAGGQLTAFQYAGLAPYGSYVGRAILLHTLAFNENPKGATAEELRYAILSPGTDISFIDDARRRFVAESAYLDDRPNAPLRFAAEANLTQILRREETHIDLAEARAQLNDRIKTIFGGSTFNLYAFPGGPYDVPGDADNIWPKVAESSGPIPSPEPDTGQGDEAEPTSNDSHGLDSGTDTGADTRKDSTASKPPPEKTLSEEGVLKEALTKLWEQARARARKFTHIRTMVLKLFDAADAFRLIGLVGAVAHADKKVQMSGGYETTDGGLFELSFEGPPADAQPIKDFLDPQLRAAKDKDLSVTFTIAFAEAGLVLANDAPEKLAERLTKFGTGAAYVAITAEGGQ